MTAARRQIPNYTTMLAAAYKAAIDASFAVDARLAGWFAPHQVYAGSPNPDLAVELDAGYIWNGTTLTEVAAQQVGGITIPASGYQRIDRIVVDSTTGVASRIAGTAQTSGSPGPSAPAITAGKIPICQVLITSSATAVLDSMITDERALPNSAGGGVTVGTEQAWSSGAALDFTGLPTGVKAIAVMFNRISTNGTSGLLLQLRASGAAVNTGYQSCCNINASNTDNTAGFLVHTTLTAAHERSGAYLLFREDASDFTWTGMGATNAPGGAVGISSGSKALAAELDGFRVTTVGGTDTGDAGAVNYMYWT